MSKEDLVLIPREVVCLFPNDWWVILFLMSSDNNSSSIKDISDFYCESMYITNKSVDALQKNGIIDIVDNICYLNADSLSKVESMREVCQKHDGCNRDIAVKLILSIRKKLSGGTHVQDIDFKKEMEGLWNI